MKSKAKKERKVQKRVETKKLRQIFRDNYEELFGGQAETEFISRDQHLNLVKKLKKKIKRDKKKKLELQSSELKNDKVSNFGKFLIYGFYIFLFMVSVSRHLSITDRYRIYTSISEDLKMSKIKVPNSLEKLSFYEIKTITDFNSWVKDFTLSFKTNREK